MWISDKLGKYLPNEADKMKMYKLLSGDYDNLLKPAYFDTVIASATTPGPVADVPSDTERDRYSEQ